MRKRPRIRSDLSQRVLLSTHPRHIRRRRLSPVRDVCSASPVVATIQQASPAKQGIKTARIRYALSILRSRRRSRDPRGASDRGGDHRALGGLSAQSAAPAPDTRVAARSASGDRVAVPEPTPQALAYHRSGTMLWVFDTVWALVLPAILLWTGLSARMRDWSARVGRRWFFVIAIYWIVFTILTTAVDLPRVYYESFMRQHAYGLSNQTLAKWASDQAANLGVTLVIGALFLWVPYLLLKRSPRRWWLYTTMLAVPVHHPRSADHAALD